MSAAASAATVSYGPVSVGPSPTGSGGSFGVTQFDPSLGTLTQVDLDVTGNSDGGSNGLQNLSGFPGNASVTIGSNITVSGPATLTVLTFPNNSNSGPVAPFTGAIDFTFSGPDSVLVNGVPSSDSNSSSITSGMAPYIGLSTVNFNYSSAANTSNAADVSPTFSSTTAPNFGFSATVTYHYTPVPEPTTLALAGLGALGLAFAARRKRNG
ncbi:MAG TPA: choice-of-anchor E domain-containing protein [Pirellulales bacterium]